MAAIAALTPSSINSPDYNNYTRAPSPLSPASSTCSTDDVIWKFRRAGSVDSTASFASSTTSLSSSTRSAELDYTHSRMGSYNFPSPPRHQSHSRKRSIIIPSRPQTPEEYQFAADTAAFVRMVRNHLANVRIMKQGTSAPSVRFRFSDEVKMPITTPVKTPVGSRVTSRIVDAEEGREELEKARRERMSRKFRPRFDPSETQRLCDEALAELAD
jgi:hypothetical protein